jgi:hypothetical protein
MTTTDYVLSITVPYTEILHGTYKLTSFNSKYDYDSLKYGYLCMYSIPLNEFYDTGAFKEWYKFIFTYSSMFIRDNIIRDSYNTHYSLQQNIVGIDPSTIVNYLQKRCGIEIVKKNKIKIIDSSISEDESYITTSIIKTHYIRLIQRKWKKLYKQMIKNRCNLYNLQYRQIHGNWPIDCLRIL